MMVSVTQIGFKSCEHKAWTFGLSKAPHQFRTRNDLIKKQRMRSNADETAVKSTKLIDILPLITVWLQVRVTPGPPAFAREASEAAAPKPIGRRRAIRPSYGSASHHKEISGLLIAVSDHRTRDASLRRTLPYLRGWQSSAALSIRPRPLLFNRRFGDLIA